ncbi:MAG: hypothetical protein RL354_878 [Planctomycetota bacterium]
MRRAALVCSVSLLSAVLVGCGDGHEYPAGFAEQAARDEAWFKAQEEAQAAEQQKVAAAGGASKAGAVAPPRAPIGSAGAAGSAADAGASISDASSASDTGSPDASPADGTAADASAGELGAASAEEAEAVRESRAIVRDLRLPPPPAVTVADGEEPFMKLAKDRKFDEFRRMCARYLQLKRELLPYGERLASGESTAEDRAIHAKIERAMEGEFPRINRYMWDDRWTELDRAAMGWILNGGLARKPS